MKSKTNISITSSAKKTLPDPYITVTGEDYYFSISKDGVCTPDPTKTGTNVIQLSALSSKQLQFDNSTPINSGRIYFSDYPNPIPIGGIDYINFNHKADWVEFSLNSNGDKQLYINTTQVDQFGFPIQLQINPPNKILPDGVGVKPSFTTVLKDFKTFTEKRDFVQCSQDIFGNPLTNRIFSPATAISKNQTQGVVATCFTGPPSTLTPGTYYYAVTMLNKDKKESYCQNKVVFTQKPVKAGESVQVAWDPNVNQPVYSEIDSYNIYRGTANKNTISWALLGNQKASIFTEGCAFADSGKKLTNTTSPPMNPLTEYFDSEIKAFFTRFKTKSSLILTATDGSSNGYVYSFSGNTDANNNLKFTLTSVINSSGKPVSVPTIPLKTVFTIYYPYWKTNTYNPTLPSPPSWEVYNSISGSAMVFLAEGVFADSGFQPIPSALKTKTKVYRILLGSLENQIVSALTRGIANSTISPLNWGNSPVQLEPTLSSKPSVEDNLKIGTKYYYVITAVNKNGETTSSLEFNATPTKNNPSIQLNWKALNINTATSINIYRGTTSQQENILIESVTNSAKTPVISYVDTGKPGQSKQPPVYFPKGKIFDVYDAFFHQPKISKYGVSYAGPYDDQNNQSSTLSGDLPLSVSIEIGACVNL